MKQCFTVVGQAQWQGDRWCQLMTVGTHGNFIVLPHWDIMTCYPIQSHYPDHEPTSPCHILIMSGSGLGSNKHQFKSHWFDSTMVRKLWGPDPNPQPSYSLISQSRRRTLYSFGHHDWLLAIGGTSHCEDLFCLAICSHHQRVSIVETAIVW